MAGKGDGRRPAVIDHAELDKAWEKTFGKKRKPVKVEGPKRQYTPTGWIDGAAEVHVSDLAFATSISPEDRRGILRAREEAIAPDIRHND